MPTLCWPATTPRWRREILWPDAVLGVEQAVLFESDHDKARAIASEHLNVYLNTKFNIAKFRRLVNDSAHDEPAATLREGFTCP